MDSSDSGSNNSETNEMYVHQKHDFTAEHHTSIVLI